MCLSVRPLLVENKILYTGEAHHPDHGYVHVFGLTASISMKNEGGNALIFPIPCKELLSEGNIIAFKQSSVFPNMMSALKRESLTELNVPRIEPHWMVANSPSAITEVLESNAVMHIDNLRAFASFIGEFYPGYSVIIGAFAGSQDLQHFTLWAWYKPAKPEVLFLPTLTSVGTLIDIDGEIPCDYWAIMSALDMHSRTLLIYQDVKKLSSYLPQRIVGKHFSGWHKNADTMAATEAIKAGFSDGILRRPFLGIYHG